MYLYWRKLMIFRRFCSRQKKDFCQKKFFRIWDSSIRFVKAFSFQKEKLFLVIVVCIDRYDVKFNFDSFRKSITSLMHASLPEDWSNTVVSCFRGKSNTLRERRGGEGIVTMRRPLCAARANYVARALLFIQLYYKFWWTYIWFLDFIF